MKKTAEVAQHKGRVASALFFIENAFLLVYSFVNLDTLMTYHSYGLETSTMWSPIISLWILALIAIVYFWFDNLAVKRTALVLSAIEVAVFDFITAFNYPDYMLGFFLVMVIMSLPIFITQFVLYKNIRKREQNA